MTLTPLADVLNHLKLLVTAHTQLNETEITLMLILNYLNWCTVDFSQDKYKAIEESTDTEDGDNSFVTISQEERST